MSTIKISQLHPTGLDLLQDSESFLHELCDRDLVSIHGGAAISQVTVSAEYSVIEQPALFNVQPALLNDQPALFNMAAIGVLQLIT